MWSLKDLHPRWNLSQVQPFIQRMYFFQTKEKIKHSLNLYNRAISFYMEKKQLDQTLISNMSLLLKLQVMQMIDVYAKFAYEEAAMHVISGRKSMV